MTPTTEPALPIVLGMTGASGACYGLRLLECLLAVGRPVHLICSPTALQVINGETDLQLPGRPAGQARALAERFAAAPGALSVYAASDWRAPAASGSAQLGPMAVCPCSMGSLAAIAGGASDNLIERAADVALKEGRRLVLVPRETPFSAIHLENMLKLARLGACVLPANPGFYDRPAGIEALVDFIVARILDQLGVAHQLGPRWGQTPA